jgi:hypothetical protein
MCPDPITLQEERSRPEMAPLPSSEEELFFGEQAHVMATQEVSSQNDYQSLWPAQTRVMTEAHVLYFGDTVQAQRGMNDRLLDELAQAFNSQVNMSLINQLGVFIEF